MFSSFPNSSQKPNQALWSLISEIIFFEVLQSISCNGCLLRLIFFFPSSNLETLDFKFLLKPKYSNTPCVVEEGPNRLLTGGTLQGDARLALFMLNGDEVLESRVFIKADRVSPFDLAASWRAFQENLQPSTVRGIPDVSINSVPETGAEVWIDSLIS